MLTIHTTYAAEILSNMLLLCLVYLSASFSEQTRAVKTKLPLCSLWLLALHVGKKMRGFTIEVNENLIALSEFFVGPPLTAYHLLLLWSGSIFNEDTFCNMKRVLLSMIIYCHYDYESVYDTSLPLACGWQRQSED